MLRDMLKQYRRSHVGRYVADAPAELGDTSAVDVFYDEWKAWLGRPGLIHDSKIAFYRGGKRRECGVTHAAVEEFRDGKAGERGRVGLRRQQRAGGQNLFAIPVLRWPSAMDTHLPAAALPGTGPHILAEAGQ